MLFSLFNYNDYMMNYKSNKRDLIVISNIIKKYVI